MSWQANSNYIPMTMDELYNALLENINAVYGTAYDLNSLKATNWYRLAYPVLQLIRQNEITFAEVNQKLLDFTRQHNVKIQSPITTNSGMVEFFKQNGFNIAVAYSDSTASGNITGLILLVDVDRGDITDLNSTFNTEIKPKIFDLMTKCWVAGVNCPTLAQYIDNQVPGYMTLSSDQNIPAKFWVSIDLPITIKLTITVSDKFRSSIIDDQTAIIDKLYNNLTSMWNLANDFEPETYFEIVRDAPYASNIELKYNFETPPTEIEGILPTYDDDGFTSDILIMGSMPMFMYKLVFDKSNITVSIN